MTPPSFDFATAARIAFGPGAAAQAAPAIRALGRRVALVTGADPRRGRWLAEALESLGAEILPVSIPAEPTVAMIEEAVARARDFGVEATAGLGGGAAMDAAKAIAGLVPQPSGVMTHLEVVGEGRPLTAPPLPAVAIPTTAGTGAEVTRNAVLGVPEHGRKVSLRDPGLLPRLAVVDPELTRGAPRAVTLASGLDALTQVIEPYLSCRANPLTDALCRDAIPRAMRALRALMEPAPGAVADDAAARADMALASLFGGLALANAGLGAVHGLAGVAGGRVGGAHGAICGRLLPHVLRATGEALAERPDARAQARLDEVAAWLGAALEAPAPEAFDALQAWIDAQGLPRLGALGLSPEDHAPLARESLASSSMKGAPVALETGALIAILEAAS
ncbi:iron-containing alcohol dehydrogenase [Oceanicella actignis]|uniref:Uncharacterized protein n=1 Tax=Oceanicella actignis TaxID=1189325 RepID=A0A1M7TN70_9RHOB|nr:iron-containing alcohol dehydrogenase [Oceanicella actignis]SET72275.1 hypothetical protein SAMN04488119_10846 [Oceanicella actignis]SHN72194.1 hypothetical protein SAMN05216200_10847 [Oceanicella actignis]